MLIFVMLQSTTSSKTHGQRKRKLKLSLIDWHYASGIYVRPLSDTGGVSRGVDCNGSGQTDLNDVHAVWGRYICQCLCRDALRRLPGGEIRKHVVRRHDVCFVRPGQVSGIDSIDNLCDV